MSEERYIVTSKGMTRDEVIELCRHYANKSRMHEVGDAEPIMTVWYQSTWLVLWDTKDSHTTNYSRQAKLLRAFMKGVQDV